MRKLLAPVFGAVCIAAVATPSMAKNKYAICVDRCKSEYPYGKTYDPKTALGACNWGCSKTNWNGRKKAKKMCRANFNPGAGHRDACIRGVDRWPR